MLKLLLLLGIISLSHQHGWKSTYPGGKKSSNPYEKFSWMKYMVGEEFFKNTDKSNDLNDADNDLEQIPYQIIKKENTYEQRYYPAATYVCNKTQNIDTAADPFGGLEKMNPWKLMSSRRWKHHHTSKMFMELFKYISGVNKNTESIEMTRPVLTEHVVVQEDPLGNYEDQEMCFYLPSKYQEGHLHQGEEEDEAVVDPEQRRRRRHAAVAPPPPLDAGKVYTFTRPALTVFVRRFGGFPITHDSWEKQKDALEVDLLDDKHKYQLNDYYTVGYDSPWKLGNRRNEVWIKCLEENHQFPAPVVEEQLRN